MCTFDGEFAHRPRGRQGLLHLDRCYVAANYAEVVKCAQSMLQIRELRRSEKIELYVLLIASGTDALIQ